MTQDQVLSLVRTMLAIAGTFLVTTDAHPGIFNSGDWQTVSGAVVIITGLIWSLLAHSSNPKVRAAVGSTR